MNSPSPAMLDNPTTPTGGPSSELSHAAIGQWGAVIAGVLGGFAATIVLATLGTALGLSVGVNAVADTDGTNETALGGAALVWLLVSATVVGAVGGTILARASRRDRAFHPGTLGLVTWTGGMVLAVMLVAGPAAGVLHGAASAGLVASTSDDARARISGAAARNDGARPLDSSASRGMLTEDERARARDTAVAAAKAATAAAWAALLAQVVSLVATIVAARVQRRRLVVREPIGYATLVPAT